MDSFWSSSPAGKIDEKYSKIADYTIVRPENPDVDVGANVGIDVGSAVGFHVGSIVDVGANVGIDV